MKKGTNTKKKPKHPSFKHTRELSIEGGVSSHKTPTTIADKKIMSPKAAYGR